jgi:hypothetical protein
MGGQISRAQAVYRVRQKLRSMSVGTTLLHMGAIRSDFCWASGFHLMGAHDSSIGQLRDLDRHRSHAVAWFSRELARLRIPAKKSKSKSKRRKSKQDLDYEGHPYSYSAIAEI